MNVGYLGVSKNNLIPAVGYKMAVWPLLRPINPQFCILPPLNKRLEYLIAYRALILRILSISSTLR